MEDYAAKMARKTDAELLQYVTSRTEYRDDAVLAALTELEQRGHQVPGAEALRTDLQATLRDAPAVTPVAPPWARPAEPEAEITEEAEYNANAPKLYTPATVGIFSVFSFVIGGILMLLNLLSVRRYSGAALLLLTMMVVISLAVWIMNAFQLPIQYVVFGCNLALALLYVYGLWPLFIGQQAFRPRSWLTPLLVVLGLQLLFALLVNYMGQAMPGFVQ